MPFIRINTSFKALASLLLASMYAFTSCVEVADDGAGATGTLVPVSLSFDVTVDEIVESKALPLPEIIAPAEDEIHYVVKDRNGNVIYSDTGLWTENLLVPVGKYTVEATFNDNGFGKPAFGGSATGTIEPFGQERVTLTLQVVNALVSVSVDSDLDDHFTPGSEVTFTSDGKSYVSGLGEYCFVPSGKPLNLKLTGTNSVGKPSVFEYNLQSPSPRSAYDVVCGKATTNWPAVSLSVDPAAAWGTRIYITSPATCSGSISDANKVIVYEAIPSSSSDWSQAKAAVVDNGVPVIKNLTEGTEYQVRARIGSLVSPVVKVTPEFSGLSVSASHTKNTAGELDGTNVTPSFTHSLSAVKSSIKSWNIDLCTSGGEMRRSGLKLGVSDGSALSGATDWPYLPADSGESYKIRASVTMTDGEVITTEVPCAVPATPDFTVSMNSYTSYDKYAGTNGISKNLNDANFNCDPSTIYNVGASWGISLNLMKNTNYLKTLLVTDNGAELRKYVVDIFDANQFYETISGCEWRAHELKASVTIVGKTCSANSRTHHVTGLPHSVQPPKNTGSNPWLDNQGNNTWAADCVKLFYEAGKYPRIISPTFHVPSDINVSVSTKVYREYFWASVSKGDIRIYRYNVSTGAESKIYKASLAREETLETTWNNVVMTSAYNSYYIQYDYMADTGETNVYYFNVYYR